MKKRESGVNIHNGSKDNKLSDDNLVEQIGENTFKIGLTLELRKLGIDQIFMVRDKFVIDTYEDRIVSVVNFEDVYELFGGIEDQLANNDVHLSSYFIDELWNFLNNRRSSIENIIYFFQDQSSKGSDD